MRHPRHPDPSFQSAPPDLGAVDLANCDREPIHLPGSIQPHGLLLAFDADGRLTHASRNARSVLPRLPRLGAVPRPAALRHSAALGVTLSTALAALRRDAAAAPDGDVPALAIEATLGGALHDVVLHARAGRVIVEAERRAVDAAELASFALLAHRSMARLKAGTAIDRVLGDAVAAVRELTGFDRVMAYRFHADDSGEVVAEVADAALDPYLGRRFPAADIPAQARRLYRVNTLRLIANVADAQVPIDAYTDPDANDVPFEPLDLSHAVLRSVSPIHIEYLKNIQVGASMSMSLVVGGRLWGLIACHHRSAFRVPYALRMACDVLAQVVAIRVQLLSDAATAARRAAATELSATLTELAACEMAHDRALPAALRVSARDFGRAIANDALILARGEAVFNTTLADSLLVRAGLVTAAPALLRWLADQSEDLLALDDFSRLPEALRDALRPACSLLALRFDAFERGWVVLLRDAQNVAMTWSGPPAKVARIASPLGPVGLLGPHGARLTPAGSMAEWREEAQGVAVRWDELDGALARQILDVVGRASAARALAMDRARNQLLAILGHDLRDPLHAITLAAAQLRRAEAAHVVQLGTRITASSARMARLIGQVLDMSRLRGGLGLGLQFVRTDLAELLRTLIDESLAAHPNVPIHADLPAALAADIDPDRFAQVLSNLLGNARQHGVAGAPIEVRLLELGAAGIAGSAACAVIEVANHADPVDASVATELFDEFRRDPFKRDPCSRDAFNRANPRNPGGLGLGLYIASEAIKGHDGTINYRHEGGRAVFTVRVPRVRLAR